MRKLDADRGVLTLHEGDQGPEALDLRIVPDSKIMLVYQAYIFDGGGLDEDQPKASEGIAAEMYVVKNPAGAARPCAVVDHRRHDQAVLQCKAANSERLKQQGSCRGDAVGGQV